MVAPGFVDIHTHYDAQAFWDTTLSPSPLHGVTTVVGGNCGFTIAPLAPEHADYLLHMLARVEGMPVSALQAGVPWNWRSFGEYLDRIDGTLAPNAGFLVGHSTIRRVVMGERATQGEATPEEIAKMQQLLDASLAAGGMGFSSSWARTHNDAAGDMVPSRYASEDEIIALCSTVREHPGTTLEFIPSVGQFEDFAPGLMTRMSLAANRPINWNVLFVNRGNEAMVEHNLAASDYARDRGANVLALTMPFAPSPRICFDSGFLLDTIPDWQKPMALPHDEKKAMLASPDGRRALREAAEQPSQGFRVANWAIYVINETFAPENAQYEGMSVGDIAKARGVDPFDALCDIVVADDLMTGFGFPARPDDDDTWRERVKVWRDTRTVIGASDAGAHLDFLATFNYSTVLLGQAVRERGLIPIEEAINLLTDRPARLYGLKERGRLAEGWNADVVVIDPGRSAPSRYACGSICRRARPVSTAVPTASTTYSSTALRSSTTEISPRHRPGTLFRSGRDTETVSVPGGA